MVGSKYSKAARIAEAMAYAAWSKRDEDGGKLLSSTIRWSRIWQELADKANHDTINIG